MWINKRLYNALLENIDLNSKVIDMNTEVIKHLIKERNDSLHMVAIKCKKDNLSSEYGMFKNIDFSNSEVKGVDNMK